MINAEYGKPVVVRFENDLDQNPQNLDRSDFGAPDFAFLTHLHNAHTAPESDGQPYYMQINEGGYIPGDWSDNLYLNYPAGGDPSEIQSFFWFHDHRMHHTGANVYKGMVGLFPIYDPGIPALPGAPADINGNVPGTGLDTGNESDPAPNLRLPGVRENRGGGTFNVKYDIPMAFYDVALDDGVTPHADQHVEVAVCGNTQPEQWGKSFFKHYTGAGFVGDIFTVNGVAYPKLKVYRRKYRFRFLDASIARIYELCLMTSCCQSPRSRCRRSRTSPA
jgi:FtsP/CotA-like multicopper oxidase with cupredoxin domain